MKLHAWGSSDVGQSRRINEDSFVLAPDVGLVAVADGMGGFQRGDLASQLACNVIKEVVAEQRHIVDLYRRSPSEATRSAVKAMLELAVQRACEEVHRASATIAGEGGRMGTTVDVLLSAGSTAFVAHVGDARIYLIRGGEAHQVTEDHSLVQQQLREGLITPDEAKRARFKNVITRALGVFPSVMVDTMTFELDEADRILLCSDGLYRYIGGRELADISNAMEAPEMPAHLVALANERGGRDNITALICEASLERGASTVLGIQERIEILRRVDLFQYCTYKELMRLSEVTTSRRCSAGTTIFRTGDEGRECYFIESGSVTIQRGGKRLAVLEANDYFGEMSFIDVPRRSADAVASSDGRFLIISRDAFLEIVKRDTELGAKLMWQMLQKLSGIVREVNERLVTGRGLSDEDILD